MARKRLRAKPIKLYYTLRYLGLKGEVETRLMRPTDAIRSAIAKEGLEWSIVDYYFYREDGTKGNGTLYNS